MATIRVYVLSDDNSGKDGFRGEHGLSLLIGLPGGHQWLWDVGQSRLFLENATKLALELSDLEGLALSHGHYDHTDGLATLLGEVGFRGPLLAHPSFAEVRYKTRQGKAPESIGLNPAPLRQRPLPFTAVSDRCELDEGLLMVSAIPRREGNFQAVDGFFFDTGASRPDPVSDDACLVAETGNGPVLILGCCHSGLANTLHHLREVAGLKAIHAVLGGLHLISAPQKALQETLESLREYSVQAVYPCHCTGKRAVAFLKENLPGRIFEIGAGMILEFQRPVRLRSAPHK